MITQVICFSLLALRMNSTDVFPKYCTVNFKHFQGFPAPVKTPQVTTEYLLLPRQRKQTLINQMKLTGTFVSPQVAGSPQSQ